MQSCHSMETEKRLGVLTLDLRVTEEEEEETPLKVFGSNGKREEEKDLRGEEKVNLLRSKQMGKWRFGILQVVGK